MIQTAFWYLHTNQFRYDQFGADTLSATTGTGQLAGKSTADVIAQSARMGWMPSYPTFDRNPLDLACQPAGILRQGQRVLPQAPPRHRLVGAGYGDARGPTARRRGMAGR